MYTVSLCNTLSYVFSTRNGLVYAGIPHRHVLVTGPLCTSDCAGECRFSANLWKLALDVTADVIVEATCNADILTTNASQ